MRSPLIGFPQLVRDFLLLDRQTALHLQGKGRKQRVIPLWKNTAAQLRGWLAEISAAPGTPLFPNRAGAPLTRSGIRDRLDRAAAKHRPSLRGHRVTPHTLRRPGCQGSRVTAAE